MTGPGVSDLPGPLFLHSWSARFTPAIETRALAALGLPASTVWPNASRAYAYPLNLDRIYRVRRVFWYNGATVNGNVDLGIYDMESLKRLYSTGSVAQSGASAPQYTSVDLVLQPGSYYLALVSSSATATFMASISTGAVGLRGMGAVIQGTALPLPDPLVPVTTIGAFWWLFGLTQTASGF
jgi:hypothetical protein